MADQFDPEKVALHLFGCCSYEDSWIPGQETLPTGWGRSEVEVKENAYVSVQDYDTLLQKYKELQVPFDPNVERTTWWWESGMYRVNRPEIDRMETVHAFDYDLLLADRNRLKAALDKAESDAEAA